MNKLITTSVFILTLLVPISVSADNHDIRSLLNRKEIRRIESAEKLIAKGDVLIEKNQALEKEIDALQNADGRIKTGKIRKLNKKIAETKVKASLYYQDGYKRYIDVLDDRIKTFAKSGNSQAQQVRDDVKSLERQARKLYNKAENKSSAEKMVELVELAQNKQQKAVELHSKCLINLSEIDEEAPAITSEEPQLADSVLNNTAAIVQQATPVDSLSLSSTATNTAAITEASMPAAIVSSVAAPIAATTDMNTAADTAQVTDNKPAPLITEPQKQETSPTGNPDVFFTIQIMADKKQASNEQLKALYKGNKEVIEMNNNDWFKYSVGRYQNLGQAKADMQTENIKGFIVAYNKNERITVKEAVTLLNGES